MCMTFWPAGQQSGHPPAGTADRRGSMDQGKHQLSSDKETQWEDSTHSNTWVETADKHKQAQRYRLRLVYLKSALIFPQFE